MGRAVVLFPEGTRTPDGGILPIQSGIELIAKKSNATTVPVVIDGAFEAWPRSRLLPGLGEIRVLYGEPLTPDQTRALPKGGYVAEINRRLRRLQTDLRRRYRRRPFRYQN
jgi:1-acyl-sn-glycerol-3-phosphate acyltransferase